MKVESSDNGDSKKTIGGNREAKKYRYKSANLSIKMIVRSIFSNDRTYIYLI